VINLTRKIVASALALAATFGTGLWIGTAIADQMPNCPQEDSCSVDYRNGAWYVKPDNG
jgi:hypothetical protein